MRSGEMKMKSDKPILLIEDDVVDAMTVRRALKDVNAVNPLDIVSNGEEALQYLRDGKNDQPCIILLDLNMPKMNGIEFLKIARQDQLLRKIPVVVLTTSKGEQERMESFNLSVAGYMIKPMDYSQFVEMVRVISTYWMLSELPE
jgi:CheY-like chemotaxis protein